jgi:hypothetical protein
MTSADSYRLHSFSVRREFEYLRRSGCLLMASRLQVRQTTRTLLDGCDDAVTVWVSSLCVCNYVLFCLPLHTPPSPPLFLLTSVVYPRMLFIITCGTLPSHFSHLQKHISTSNCIITEKDTKEKTFKKCRLLRLQ